MGLPFGIWLIYQKQIRSILEFGAPVCTSGLTKVVSLELERVQKSFLHIAHGGKYYYEALKIVKLESLEARRIQLCTH